MIDEREKITVYDSDTEESRNFWVGKLLREISTSNLIPDYERPEDYVSEREYVEVALAGDVFERLIKLTNNSSFLIYAALLTGLNICLHKYTGNIPIIVGSPPRRAGDETAPLLNALAIVNDVEPHLSVRELLAKVRVGLLEAYDRQGYPFERLVRHLELDAIENRCPLFDVAMSLEDIHGLMPEVRNDITIALARTENDISGVIGFNPSVFARESIERFKNHFIETLRWSLAETARPISELDIMSSDERRRVLVEWNQTQAGSHVDAYVHQLIEEQAKRTPDAAAAVFGGAELTYGQLNERAGRLAHYLQQLGVGPDALVGMCVGRSFEMLVGLLGVLKAGGAYVPLDPAYPTDRLSFMLDDTQARVLLTQEHLADKFPGYEGRVIRLDAEWAVIEAGGKEPARSAVTAQNLAYAIYTSGSTGAPKAVMISHAALTCRALSMVRNYGLGASHRLLQFVSFGFDAAAEEIFPVLLCGATLALHENPTEIPPAALLDVCERLKVTTLHIPPSYWHQLIDELVAAERPVPPWVRLFITGGESISMERLVKWVERTQHPCRIFNAYGPTEATITTTSFDVPKDPPALALLPRLPIGRPMENTEIYLLDSSMRPVALGAAGELYVGGSGLARGYLNLPGETAEKFLPNPFSREPGARLYRTGDRARYLPSGDLDFLGRVDDQVKLRGFRIETSEVAAALRRHPGVRDAAVVVREDVPGDKRLVAYVVADREPCPTPGELRGFLIKQLPIYMLPSAFVALDDLPLNWNGKVDPRALPVPESPRPETAESSAAAPQTPIEEVLAGIYAEVLGIEWVGATDDFFEVGGHSLLATQLVSRVREAFQVEISVRNVFESPTVGELAKRIETERREAHGLTPLPMLPVSRDKELPLSFAQQRLWFLHQLAPSSPAYNFPATHRLRGRLDTAALLRTLNEIVRRHEALRTTFPAHDGQPRQIINRSLTIDMPVVELCELDEDRREDEVLRLVTAETNRPFDLARGPLLRALLLRAGEEDYVVSLTMHHIVTDGWSLEIFVRETTTLYEAFRKGKPSPLPPLPIQYADYAHWQREWLRGETLEGQLAYWKKALAGAPPLIHLPTDRPRPLTPSGQGATFALTLSDSLSEQLRALSRQEDVTLFMTLLAAFQLLLHSYSGQDHIVVGTNIANRNRGETEGLIGFFINNLALVADLSDNPTFRQLLARVREATLGAYDHQDIPFEKVVEELKPERHLSHAALFQVFFVLQNVPQRPLKLTGLNMSVLDLEGQTSKFDVGLYMVEMGAGIHGTIEYSTDLFERETIRRMVKDFKLLLEEVVANPDDDAATLSAVTGEDTVAVGDFNADIEVE